MSFRKCGSPQKRVHAESHCASAERNVITITLISWLVPGTKSLQHLRQNKAYMSLLGYVSVFASIVFAFQVTRPAEIPFEKHTIDLGSSESAAIADINGDGKLDIISGESWYEAPRWIKHHFR